jgi:hypothetical protein
MAFSCGTTSYIAEMKKRTLLQIKVLTSINV